MMSVQCEKNSKDKQGFTVRVVDGFETYPRRLQLLFVRETDKFCHVKKSWFAISDHGNAFL